MTEREALTAWAIKALASRRVWTSAEVWAAAWQASRKQALEEAAALVENAYPPLNQQLGMRVEIGAGARGAFADAIRSLTPTGEKA